MKKQKALEEMTHKDLFEALIYDENIQDNLNVSNDYAPDKYGNEIITLGFEGPAAAKKKATHVITVFSFNKKGRLVNMEVAMREKGQRKWQIASSGTLMDFSTRYSTDLLTKKEK